MNIIPGLGGTGSTSVCSRPRELAYPPSSTFFLNKHKLITIILITKCFLGSKNRPKNTNNTLLKWSAIWYITSGGVKRW